MIYWMGVCLRGVFHCLSVHCIALSTFEIECIGWCVVCVLPCGVAHVVWLMWCGVVSRGVHAMAV